MTITEYATVLNLHITIRWSWHSDQWTASFDHVETMRDGMLESDTGRGPTPWAALQNYAEKLCGKRIAVDAMNPTDRREYDVPKELTA